MGYTQYWYKMANLDPISFKAFSEDCQKVLAKSGVEMTYLRSGKVAHGFSVSDELVNFNGYGKDGHETFYFERDVTHNPLQGVDLDDEDKDKIFGFCKTAQKPYDVCVVACLILAKIHFGNDVKITSDGEVSDWEEGAKLVKKVTSYNFNMYQGKDYEGKDDSRGFQVEMEKKVVPKPPEKDPEQVKKEQEEFKKSKLYELVG